MAKKTIYLLSVAAMVSAIGLAGCSPASEAEVAKAGNVNQAPSIANKSAEAPVPAKEPGSAVPANTPPLPVGNNSGIPVNGKKPSSPVSQPTPNIGSGGDDFSLFTQVRGQLSVDAELSKAVIIDVKEGVATLNGNVSSQAQKSKAEQIVRSVKGIKSLKNNLRVTS